MPDEKCEEVEMSVPKQEKQLKKKCLLPDDGANVNAALTARGKLIFSDFSCMFLNPSNFFQFEL